MRRKLLYCPTMWKITFHNFHLKRNKESIKKGNRFSLKAFIFMIIKSLKNILTIKSIYTDNYDFYTEFKLFFIKIHFHCHK
jgi:uncharacterized protein (DUF1684 family)